MCVENLILSIRLLSEYYAYIKVLVTATVLFKWVMMKHITSDNFCTLQKPFYVCTSLNYEKLLVVTFQIPEHEEMQKVKSNFPKFPRGRVCRYREHLYNVLY
jgi:hypothetical protein